MIKLPVFMLRLPVTVVVIDEEKVVFPFNWMFVAVIPDVPENAPVPRKRTVPDPRLAVLPELFTTLPNVRISRL